MKKLIGLFAIVIAVLTLGYWYSKPQEIKIGFVAGLSGKYSSLGHSVLNGVRLALEETEYRLGDNKLVLIEQDDQQNPQKAKNIIEWFKTENIHLIIGNTTSSMTKESLTVLEKYSDLLMISPTASSHEFSNKDDNFLRTQVSHNTSRFDKLSEYLLSQKLEKIYMVYDEKNKSYVNNYLNNFEQSFIEHGGLPFVKKEKLTPNYLSIINGIKKSQAHTVLVIANSIDSSKFIQYLRIHGLQQPVVVSGWAKTDDFIENGGKYVEGAIFTTGYDDNSKAQAYMSFVEKYEKRYGNKPSVFSAQAYETMNIVFEMLKKTPDISQLKKNILQIRKFAGLQGSVIFNQFGDVDRDYFLMTVHNNQFKKILSK